MSANFELINSELVNSELTNSELKKMYSAKVLDHFHHPRNVGEIAGAVAVAETSNPVCGDVMKMWAVIEEGRVREIKFKTLGCVPAVACGSWLTERVTGRPLAELRSITPEEIERGLDGLPPASRHAAMLAADALKALLTLVDDSSKGGPEGELFR